MIIVDSHAHVSLRWYEPVETLLFQMENNAVNKAVLVQSVYDYDNRYGLECARGYPGRFGVVVAVDTRKPDAPQALRMLAEQGASGVRLRPGERSPGTDPLAIWREASELGFPVTSMGTEGEFASEDFRRLVDELPDLRIVLEHLGCGVGRVPDRKLFEGVLGLAEYENVYIKLAGFGELLPMPKPLQTPTFAAPPPEVRMAFEAFGRRRMMWGSNFPNCSGREGYRNTLRLPLGGIPFFDQEDREWIFGKTALSVWKVPDA